MQITAQFCFTLDVGEFAVAGVYDTAYTGRFTKGAWMSRIFQYRQAINLTNDLTVGFNADLPEFNLILHTFLQIAFAPGTGVDRSFKGFQAELFLFVVQRRL